MQIELYFTLVPNELSRILGMPGFCIPPVLPLRPTNAIRNMITTLWASRVVWLAGSLLMKFAKADSRIFVLQKSLSTMDDLI